MRSHQFKLTIPSRRFQKIADKIVRSGVEVTYRGCMVDLAVSFNGNSEDPTMQEALDVIKTARGGGRHGCLRNRLAFLDNDDKVIGVQQTITFG